MDRIQQFVQEHKVLVTGVGGVIVGLILGLIVGWVIWPVNWVNSPPKDLRIDFKTEYLTFVADDYAANGNLELARRRLLGDPAANEQLWPIDDLVAALDTAAAEREGAQGDHLRVLAQAMATAPAAEATAPAAGFPWLQICLIAALVMALAIVLVILSRRLMRGGRGAAAAVPVGGVMRHVETVSGAWGVSGPPLSQFVTSYVLGDDHYDPSFSIELESGEFMGECGVGISEVIGGAEPKQVTALEVWLFDKNDIRTVTKVLMSEYAYNDPALRAKLAPKGEPVLIEPGREVQLETATLRISARVTDMEYGEGRLPPSSFFQQVTMELAAWKRGGSEGSTEIL